MVILFGDLKAYRPPTTGCGSWRSHSSRMLAYTNRESIGAARCHIFERGEVWPLAGSHRYSAVLDHAGIVSQVAHESSCYVTIPYRVTEVSSRCLHQPRPRSIIRSEIRIDIVAARL